MKLKLLIVEDDIMLGELISHYFTKKTGNPSLPQMEIWL